MRLNNRNNRVASVTLLAREVKEFADAREHCTLLRCAHDTHASTSSEIKQTFIAKNVQGPDHRVLVHAKHVGEINRRRQTFAGLCFALGDRAANLRGYLVVKGHRLVFIDSGFSHSTIRYSTIYEQRRKGGPMIISPSKHEALHTDTDPTELLIKEARRKARRRRLLVSAVGLVVVAAIVIALVVVMNSAPKPGAPSLVNASGPQLQPCSIADLSFSVGQWQAAAGNEGVPIVMTNVGGLACSLNGYPRLTLRTTGTPLRPISIAHSPGSQIWRSEQPHQMELSPGATASFGVGFGDASNQNLGTTVANGPHCIITSAVIGPPTGGSRVLRLTNHMNACFANYHFGITPIEKGTIPDVPPSY